MPCSPNDLSIDIPDQGGPAIPQIDGIPGLSIPSDFPEDLLGLFNALNLILPSGIIKPSLSPNFTKSIGDAIKSILEQFIPFLMIFKFILPILNMILCIIEVLCAIPNPFKLIRAIRRLFRTCIPEFLSLFPIFALIIMILSLLLLILALIEYLLRELARIIKQILRNLILMQKVVNRKDSRSALIVASKIGGLLCLLQNIFLVFAVIAIIFQVIEDLRKFSARIPPCDDSGNDSNDGCCTPDVCPAFIKVSGTIHKFTGNLQYLPEAGINSGLTLPPGFTSFFSTLRPESWQFYDTTLAQNQQFSNIVAPYDVDPNLGLIFFPQGKTYTDKTNPNKVPYTVDLRFFYDPALFGRTDVKGARFVRVNKTIVSKTPELQLTDYNNARVGNPIGILSLLGGAVYEDDGTTPVFVNNAATTLNTLIHQAPNLTGSLFANEGALLQNVEYTFTINYEELLAESLITLGCVPDVALDRTTTNGAFGSGDAGGLANVPLPDMTKIQNCFNAALAQFRARITPTTTATFQQDITQCLNDLKADTLGAFKSLFDLGFSPYKSTFSLNPAIQFTTQPIKVAVQLNDANGVNLCTNVPIEVEDDIKAKLQGVYTFGKLSDFSYSKDDQKFNALLTSDVAGEGTMKIMYNNTFISTVTIPTDLNQTVAIKVVELPYRFIKSAVVQSSDGTILQPDLSGDGAPRRDDGDTSRESGQG